MPEGHCRHAVVGSRSWSVVPGSHGSQVLAGPSGTKVPTEQRVHAVEGSRSASTNPGRQPKLEQLPADPEGT